MYISYGVVSLNLGNKNDWNRKNGKHTRGQWPHIHIKWKNITSDCMNGSTAISVKDATVFSRYINKADKNLKKIACYAIVGLLYL